MGESEPFLVAELRDQGQEVSCVDFHGFKRLPRRKPQIRFCRAGSCPAFSLRWISSGTFLSVRLAKVFLPEPEGEKPGSRQDAPHRGGEETVRFKGGRSGRRS